MLHGPSGVIAVKLCCIVCPVVWRDKSCSGTEEVLVPETKKNEADSRSASVKVRTEVRAQGYGAEKAVEN